MKRKGAAASVWEFMSKHVEQLPLKLVGRLFFENRENGRLEAIFWAVGRYVSAAQRGRKGRKGVAIAFDSTNLKGSCLNGDRKVSR